MFADGALPPMSPPRADCLETLDSDQKWFTSPEAMVGCKLQMCDSVLGQQTERPIPVGSCGICHQLHFSARSIEICFLSHFKPYKCYDSHCNQRFSDRHQMLAHVHNSHRNQDGSYTLYCVQCNKLMPDLSTVERHKDQHLQELQMYDVSFSCPYCKLYTHDAEHFFSHMSRHRTITVNTLDIPSTVPDHALNAEMVWLRNAQRTGEHTGVQQPPSFAFRQDVAVSDLPPCAEMSFEDEGQEEQPPEATPPSTPQEQTEVRKSTTQRRPRPPEEKRVLCTACGEIYARPSWAKKHPSKCKLWAHENNRNRPHQVHVFKTAEEASEFRQRLRDVQQDSEKLVELLKSLPVNTEALENLRLSKRPLSASSKKKRKHSETIAEPTPTEISQ